MNREDGTQHVLRLWIQEIGTAKTTFLRSVAISIPTALGFASGLFFDILAWDAGLFPPGEWYAGVSERPNWSLSFALVLVLGFATYHLRRQFERTWEHAAGLSDSQETSHDVLLHQWNGEAYVQVPNHLRSEFVPFVRFQTGIIRLLSALMATAFAVTLVYVDSAAVRRGLDELDFQAEATCSVSPSDFVAGEGQKTLPSSDINKAGDQFECDFFVAHALNKDITNEMVRGVAEVAYFTEAILAYLALTCLVTVLAHVACFHSFSRRDLRWTFKLDPYSPLGEFGLEHWNYALNNVYWILSLGLIAPLLSGASQPSSTRDTGQLIMATLLPILIGSPMVVSIISRQHMVARTWASVIVACQDPTNDVGNVKLLRFQQQRLWPLTANWTSKLGLVLAFALLSTYLGFSLSNILGL